MGEHPPDLYCDQELNVMGTCGNTHRGIQISYAHSTYKLSDDQGYTDLNKALICTTASVFNNLQNGTNGTLRYQFGSESGFYRVFPGIIFNTYSFPESCEQFDPRTKSWYVSATIGPKNILMIIDNSGSMITANRLLAAKRASIAVIETLNENDRIGFVFFGREAINHTNILTKATDSYKTSLIDYINGMGYSPGTNFRTGFELGYDILDYSKSMN